jgi:hypothetical protein
LCDQTTLGAEIFAFLEIPVPQQKTLTMTQSIFAWIDDFLGGRAMGPFETYGVDPQKFIIQSTIWLIPTVIAIMHVMRHRTGIRLAGWMVAIVFLPIVGAVAAFIVVRNPKQQNA